MIRAEYIIDRADLIGFCVVLSFVVMFAASFLSKYFFGFDMFERLWLESLERVPRTYLRFMGLVILTFATHELLHAVPVILRSGKLSAVKFGIGKGTLYTHIREPLSRGFYILVTVLPLLVLGIGGLILGWFLDDMLVVFIALLNIAVSAGDLMLLVGILRKSEWQLVRDHESEIGFIRWDTVVE